MINEKWHEKTFGGDVNIYILIVKIVSCIYAKRYQVIDFKYVQFILQLYYNNVVTDK